MKQYLITLIVTPNEDDGIPIAWNWQSLLDLSEPVEVVNCVDYPLGDN